MSATILHDFRSDTVTRPSAAMRAAMADAVVGDDVFGDDASVNLLQQRVAALFGKQAGLFVPSGTQSNLIALMSHCERGDEYLVGQKAHCYRWEAGGAAVLGSIQPQPIENQPDGTLRLTDIQDAIKPNDPHFARTRLLALENTIGGQVLPPDYLEAATTLAREHGLACHLDGARVFNACVKLGMSPADMARAFDSVSVCLSKGLGAPVGSVLLGTTAFIGKAHRLRKMLGGGMRQAGVLAAAGLHAIEHNIGRLADDHYRAEQLAEGLRAFPSLRVASPQTNILFVEVAGESAAPLAAHLAEQGIGITSAYGHAQQRWVTHLDISDESVRAALDSVAHFFRQR